jgi:transposase
MAYFSEREKQLGMYLHDGMLLMDTNLIENTIRPIALGRNNYLFAGSHSLSRSAGMQHKTPPLYILYLLHANCIT